MQLLKDGDWVADMKQVFFALGNTAEKYKDPQASANVNFYRWTLYVTLADGKSEQTGTYIKSVTYTLNKAFSPSEVTLTDPPFLLARVGYRTFTVKVRIEYHSAYLNLKSQELEHDLSFQGSNAQTNFFQYVDPVAESRLIEKLPKMRAKPFEHHYMNTNGQKATTQKEAMFGFVKAKLAVDTLTGNMSDLARPDFNQLRATPGQEKVCKLAAELDKIDKKIEGKIQTNAKSE